MRELNVYCELYSCLVAADLLEQVKARPPSHAHTQPPHKPARGAHSSALSTFVEAALDAHLKLWVQWVKKVESGLVAALASAGKAGCESLTPQQLLGALPEGLQPSVDPLEAEGVVKDLGLTWRTALSSLNDEVTRYTSGPGGAAKSAMSVLKAVFSKLAEYHQRGEALLGRAFIASPPPWFRELVPLQNIYFEMRRFGRAE